MVKTVRCSSCGAGLRPAHGQPNVVCEYCNSFVRVADDRAEQFDETAILSQIVQIWPRVRNDSFTSEYEAIKDLISRHKYIDACKSLNRILERDHTQARAWFYKALLPVLEQETVLFKGCYINLVRVSQIVKRDVLRKYLKSCGLPLWRHREFLDFYRSTDFLYEQQVKFLDKAVENASTEERSAFFKKAKAERVKIQKQKLRRRRFANIALILLLGVVVVAACVIIWSGLEGNFFW